MDELSVRQENAILEPLILRERRMKMGEEVREHACAEAKEYTKSDLKRAICDNVEPIQKENSELKSQNFKLKMAIRALADAMTS